MKKRNVAMLVFTMFLIVALSVEYYYERGGDFLAVSSSAGQRELPIYCVKTDKPQIALTFDAAWAGAILRLFFSNLAWRFLI